MTVRAPQHLTFETGKSGAVSALVLRPEAPRACFVFAHGAGAGMTHSFMEAFAIGLFERGLASLRYQFPYMEKGSKRPDPPAIAQATVRAAVAKAAEIFPGLALIAGGVRGLAFVGFPLHPAGKPSTGRADHLAKIDISMLFLQGTRDSLAEAALIEPVVQRLGSRATLHLAEGADHSFHVLARSGRKDAEVMNEILDAFAGWVSALVVA